MDAIIAKTVSSSDTDFTFVRFDLRERALSDHLSGALAECERAIGLDRIARQTFFLSPKVPRSGVMALVEEAYGRPSPVTSYVYQPPANGHAVSCELWASPTEVPLRRSPHLSCVSTPAATWAFLRGETGTEGRPLGDAVRRMLHEAEQHVRSGGFEFTQMVRTWYYIGDILGNSADGPRYAAFNASRNEFYRDKWPDLCATPASTGVGMDTGGTVFEGLLIKPASGAEVSWIDNPLQTPPYLYDIRTEQSRKPSFSRAAAVRLADRTLTFISGTASIRGSRVVHHEDAAAQTEATIENMAVLVNGQGLDDLQQVRVYVKRPEDVQSVRECCRANLPDAPCSYLIADVCKPDCLVEIEGIHVSANAARATASGDRSDSSTRKYAE